MLIQIKQNNKVIDFDYTDNITYKIGNISLRGLACLQYNLALMNETTPIQLVSLSSEIPQLKKLEFRKAIPLGIPIEFTDKITYESLGRTKDMNEKLTELVPSLSNKDRAELLKSINNVDAEIEKINKVLKAFKPKNAEMEGILKFHFQNPKFSNKK